MPFELHRAVEVGNLVLVKSHVKNGASINEFNEYGLTPLFIASLYSHNKLASFLIANEADVNLGCRTTNNPPMLFAVLRENVELVDILIKNGANVEEWILDFVCNHINIFENGFIKIIKLSIPALLLENPDMAKPWYVELVTELSSFWDEKAAILKSLGKIFNTETKESLLERIAHDRKKIGTRSLLSQAFFNLPTVQGIQYTASDFAIVFRTEGSEVNLAY